MSLCLSLLSAKVMSLVAVGQHDWLELGRSVKLTRLAAGQTTGSICMISCLGREQRQQRWQQRSRLCSFFSLHWRWRRRRWRLPFLPHTTPHYPFLSFKGGRGGAITLHMINSALLSAKSDVEGDSLPRGINTPASQTGTRPSPRRPPPLPTPSPHLTGGVLDVCTACRPAATWKQFTLEGSKEAAATAEAFVFVFFSCLSAPLTLLLCSSHGVQSVRLSVLSLFSFCLVKKAAHVELNVVQTGRDMSKTTPVSQLVSQWVRTS